MSANLENSQWSQDWKRSLFILIPKKGNAKECSSYRTIALISHASKVMLKILQARFQHYVNCELPDVEMVLEKSEEPKIKLPTSAGSSKKQESSRKTSISALLTMPKPLIVENFSRDGNTRPPDLPLEKPGQVRKQQLELDMEHRLVPNRKKSTSRLYIVTLLIKLICRVHNEKCWAGWSISWNQDCWEKYQ